METRQLDHEEIQTFCAQISSSLNIEVLETATSTNDIAKERLIEQPEKMHLIATNKQTAGRGRQGKSFYSSLKHGLYFSIALKPNESSLTNIPLYTIMAAAALIEVLESSVEEPLAIKWVNDIFYNGRKISGILSEMVSNGGSLNRPGVVVGIGINFAGSFNEADEQTKGVAGTLFGEELPESFNQNQFLSEYVNQFHHYHQHFQEKVFMKPYEEHLMGVGQTVTFKRNNQLDEGTIRGINAHGHLLVEKADGTIEALYGQAIHFSSSQFAKE
ncbi:MAG TPA: biotin--[acetyl-CoA-carboxylase] ligase [Atopostipes sp.]|nr:biotin--[acetyl-CoA-carboxylase] ligase [Atopostipes sp.]